MPGVCCSLFLPHTPLLLLCALGARANHNSIPKRRNCLSTMDGNNFNYQGYQDYASTKEDDFVTGREGELACPGGKNKTQGRKRRSNKSDAFPVRLHYVLSELEKDGQGHAMSWQPHGRCFIVRDRSFVEKNVLPLWFRQSKISSFQRQLTYYGFRRITSGPDMNGYYHEKFLRGKPFLAKYISSVPSRKFDKVANEGRPQVQKASPPVDLSRWPSLPPTNARSVSGSTVTSANQSSHERQNVVSETSSSHGSEEKSGTDLSGRVPMVDSSQGTLREQAGAIGGTSEQAMRGEGQCQLSPLMQSLLRSMPSQVTPNRNANPQMQLPPGVLSPHGLQQLIAASNEQKQQAQPTQQSYKPSLPSLLRSSGLSQQNMTRASALVQQGGTGLLPFSSPPSLLAPHASFSSQQQQKTPQTVPTSSNTGILSTFDLLQRRQGTNETATTAQPQLQEMLSLLQTLQQQQQEQLVAANMQQGNANGPISDILSLAFAQLQQSQIDQTNLQRLISTLQESQKNDRNLGRTT